MPSHNLLEGETLPRDVYTHPDFLYLQAELEEVIKVANESWSALQKNKRQARRRKYSLSGGKSR